jgi:hypothetical protein
MEQEIYSCKAANKSLRELLIGNKNNEVVVSFVN